MARVVVMAVHTVMMVTMVAVRIVAKVVGVTVVVTAVVVTAVIVVPVVAKDAAKQHPIEKIAHSNKNLWLYFCDIGA